MFLIESGLGRLVEKAVVPSFVHRPSRIGPTGPRPPYAANDETPGLGVHFDFLGEFRLIEQGFGHPDAARVADSDDPCLGRHVITL